MCAVIPWTQNNLDLLGYKIWYSVEVQRRIKQEGTANVQ